MNTTKENSNSPQHPLPEHAPWQGNLGEDLEEENEEISPGGAPFLLPVQGAGGGQGAPHPLALRFGVGCEGRGLFAIRGYNIPSCREEGQFLQVFQAFLPQAGADSPRQLDTSHWPVFYIFLIDGEGTSAAISLLLICSNTRDPPKFRLEPQWPENSFPPGSPCSGSFPLSVSWDGTPTRRDTLTGGMWWSHWQTRVPGRGGAFCSILG